MIGIFRQKNPGNALFLLLYGLVLKFPLFLFPVLPVPGTGDGYLYTVIVRYLAAVTHDAPMVFSVLAFLLFFTQATLLNRIANLLKVFPKPNFLVGMAFMLVTSLMKEFTSFSAPLLVNSLLIWIWYKLISLHNNNDPKSSIYNVAVLVGLLPLIYSPAVAFILLLWMGIVITRPLRITEWLVALLGLLTPYYFLFFILFLTDNWQNSSVFPSLYFHLPSFFFSRWVIGALLLLVIPMLSGAYFVQANINKIQIQVRKAWSLMSIFLVIVILTIFINPGNGFLHWLLVAVPFASFHAATYYYTRNRWVAALLHWIGFAFCIMINYPVFT